VSLRRRGLDPDNSGSLSGLSGQIVETLTLVCTTYRMEVALDATLIGPDGSESLLDFKSIHVESGDRLDFDIAGKMGSTELERAEGTAARTDNGVTVSITAPAAKTLDLKGPIRFPVAMLKAALAAAKAGETFTEITVFDGSGHGEEVWTLSIIISPEEKVRETADEAELAAGLGLSDLRRWPMKLSYFPPSTSGEQTPAFATSAVVYENGFSLGVSYDYQQFAMKLELAEFKPIAPTPCP
jgi:hypothetical protein